MRTSTRADRKPAESITPSRMSIEDNAREPQNQRPLEAGIHTDLEGRMTYGGYLQLGRLLSAQQPLSARRTTTNCSSSSSTRSRSCG